MDAHKQQMAHAAKLRAEAHALLLESAEQALSLFQQSMDAAAALSQQVNDEAVITFVATGRWHVEALQRHLEAERQSLDLARRMQERWELEANH